MKLPRSLALFSWMVSALGLSGAETSAPAVASVAAPATTAYLFTYFVKNGEDGLHLAWSRDGYQWEALNDGASYLTPRISKVKLMRDPCVVRGPDGTYHMVWTSGWWENNIGYASTKDFIRWSEQKELPVMAHEPTVRNTWAPEIVFDDPSGEYTIFWASTIPGRFPETAAASEDQLNHRMYATTTTDFATFTPTKLFYDPGFSCIDATVLRAADGLRLIIKDETRNPPKKHLQLATAASPAGPFGELSAPFTPPGLWVEGPTAIRIGDEYLVYFDAYTKKHYGALRSKDLKTWEDVTAQMSFPNEGTPQRMRHGTVIEVPMALIEKLLRTAVVVDPPTPAAPAKAATEEEVQARRQRIVEELKRRRELRAEGKGGAPFAQPTLDLAGDRVDRFLFADVPAYACAKLLERVTEREVLVSNSAYLRPVSAKGANVSRQECAKLLIAALDAAGIKVVEVPPRTLVLTAE